MIWYRSLNRGGGYSCSPFSSVQRSNADRLIDEHNKVKGSVAQEVVRLFRDGEDNADNDEVEVDIRSQPSCSCRIW
jgi:hypothetical protein